MNGLKYDEGKPMLDLIPPEAIMAIGKVMTYGAMKYGPNNWQGVEPRRYVAALLRHLMAYQAGEMDDPESGMPHLWHVATNAAFLVTLMDRGRCAKWADQGGANTADKETTKSHDPVLSAGA